MYNSDLALHPIHNIFTPLDSIVGRIYSLGLTFTDTVWNDNSCWHCLDWKHLLTQFELSFFADTMDRERALTQLEYTMFDETFCIELLCRHISGCWHILGDITCWRRFESALTEAYGAAIQDARFEKLLTHLGALCDSVLDAWCGVCVVWYRWDASRDLQGIQTRIFDVPLYLCYEEMNRCSVCSVNLECVVQCTAKTEDMLQCRGVFHLGSVVDPEIVLSKGALGSQMQKIFAVKAGVRGRCQHIFVSGLAKHLKNFQQYRICKANSGEGIYFRWDSSNIGFHTENLVEKSVYLPLWEHWIDCFVVVYSILLNLKFPSRRGFAYPISGFRMSDISRSVSSYSICAWTTWDPYAVTELVSYNVAVPQFERHSPTFCITACCWSILLILTLRFIAHLNNSSTEVFKSQTPFLRSNALCSLVEHMRVAV